ncbi:MAG: HDOD domain-containing protein [Sedimenticola sp.]|nr:HDOD domain-containing protein [Sedimenticola sp.]
MDNRLDYWTTQLATASLPPLDDTRTQVARSLNKQSGNNADLQQIVIRDPGFALALFRTLSRLPNAPREPVSALSHALTLLGTGQVSRAADPLPKLAHYPPGKPRRALLAGYSRAGHAAGYLAAWGHKLGLSNTEELATAVLFMELAELLLWSQASQEMEQRQLLIARGQTPMQAERTLFGFELDQLSRALAERWGLPPLVAQSLQPAGAFRQHSLMVMLAASLARESQRDWYSNQTRDLLELVAEMTRTTPDRAVAWMHSEAAAAARALHPLPLAVNGLIAGPGQRPTKRKLPRTETTGRSAGDRETALPPVPVREAALPALTAAISATPERNRRLGQLMNELKSQAGVERIMVAIFNSNGDHLKVKYIVGADKSAPLRRFQHPAGGRHLFAVMLKKPQGVWLNGDNRQKLLPLLTEQARNTLNSDGFYMSSLFVKNRPLGILYADRNNPETLDRQGFSRFKTLAQRLANELSATA